MDQLTMREASAQDQTLLRSLILLQAATGIDLMTDEVELLDTYDGGMLNCKRWIIHDPKRGFGFMMETAEGAKAPMIMYTTSLFLAYEFDKDTLAVGLHTLLHKNEINDLMQRFAEPLGPPSVLVYSDENVSAYLRGFVFAIQTLMSWDRVSVSIEPSDDGKTSMLRFAADEDGLWVKPNEQDDKDLPL